jgi:hypothetical protein
MNLLTGSDADEFFGGCEPEFARQMLHQAASLAPQDAGALLWSAQALAPQSLGIYYALYKHHAGRREFEPAERAARRGLLEAARQAGLAEDWRTATRASLPPGIDFNVQGVARFWLFTLKALAFIALRSGRPEEARNLLAQITTLAPGAQIGDEVIESMLASLAAPAADDAPAAP